MDAGQDVHLLRACIEAQIRMSAGIADRDTQHVRWFLFAVRIRGIGRNVNSMMERNHGGSLRHIGEEGGGEIEIRRSRVVVTALERGVVADLACGLSVLLACY